MSKEAKIKFSRGENVKKIMSDKDLILYWMSNKNTSLKYPYCDSSYCFILSDHVIIFCVLLLSGKIKHEL